MGNPSKVSSKILISPNEPIDLLYKFTSSKWNPMFLRFMASAVTLSGSQLGNTCPFPALKAGLSPSCSPRWVPHCSQQIFAQGQWIPLKSEEIRRNPWQDMAVALYLNAGGLIGCGFDIYAFNNRP